MKSITLDEGRNLFWRESGEGAPLLLLHGWGSSSAIFSGAISELADFQTFAFDLPGYGASDPATEFTLQSVTDDLLHWLDIRGLQSVHLLGWSLGGLIAQHLALTAPERLRSLILLSSTPRFATSPDWPHGLSDTSVRALGRNFQRNPDTTLQNFWQLQFQGEDDLPSFRPVTIDSHSALAGLEVLRQTDLRSRLSEIIVPTLILHGSSDAIIPAGAGRALAAGISGALYHEFVDRGHAPFVSGCQAVCHKIRIFLS